MEELYRETYGTNAHPPREKAIPTRSHKHKKPPGDRKQSALGAGYVVFNEDQGGKRKGKRTENFSRVLKFALVLIKQNKPRHEGLKVPLHERCQRSVVPQLCRMCCMLMRWPSTPVTCPVYPPPPVLPVKHGFSPLPAFSPGFGTTSLPIREWHHQRAPGRRTNTGVCLSYSSPSLRVLQDRRLLIPAVIILQTFDVVLTE